MKTVIAAFLSCLVLASVQAQALRPEAVRGAFWGGLAGGVIGNNSGTLRHQAWRGAAYGAGAGLVLGSAAGRAHDYHYGSQVPRPNYPRTYVYRHGPRYRSYPGYYYDDRAFMYGYADVPYAVSTDERPSYAANGLLLGALAGAVIGNNSGDLHHNGWLGAAYGGAAGYLLGSIAEHDARRREGAESVAAASAAPIAEAATTAPSEPAHPATPVATPAESRMSQANRLFGRQ